MTESEIKLFREVLKIFASATFKEMNLAGAVKLATLCGEAADILKKHEAIGLADPSPVKATETVEAPEAKFAKQHRRK